jgi:hypothetical protein
MFFLNFLWFSYHGTKREELCFLYKISELESISLIFRLHCQDALKKIYPNIENH